MKIDSTHHLPPDPCLASLYASPPESSGTDEVPSLGPPIESQLFQVTVEGVPIPFRKREDEPSDTADLRRNPIPETQVSS